MSIFPSLGLVLFQEIFTDALIYDTTHTGVGRRGFCEIGLLVLLEKKCRHEVKRKIE
jgi:hypothetical protein